MTSRLEKARCWIETIAHVAVILGVPIFAIQYWTEARNRETQDAAQLTSQRADLTMRYIQMENDSERTSLRGRLSAPWDGVNVKALMAANPTRAGLAHAKESITTAVKDQDIDQMVEFYEGVVHCRNANFCEQKLTDSFFKDEISDFYCAYEPRLPKIAENLNRSDYAQAIRDYAGSCD